MTMFKQPEIDAISNTLQRAARRSNRLPETKVDTWFVNTSVGPDFWVGPPTNGMQPLFYEPAYPEQRPVAWREKDGTLVTPDRSLYRSDLQWLPLFLARGETVN